jgi:hypothetical protein
MMVNKNAQTNSTIESYLLINPQLKRDPLEIEELEKKNIFKNEVVSKNTAVMSAHLVHG